MRKYHLLAKVRKKNPYKQMNKKTQEHTTVSNILNREFTGNLPYKKTGTDITYIRWNARWVYLSIVKDMVSGEVLAHILSLTLELTLVQETYKQLGNKYHNNELT